MTKMSSLENSNPSSTLAPLSSFIGHNITTAKSIFEEDFYEISSLVRVTVPLCFGVIAVTGFFGNILVILVVCLNKQMHSTTNLLIVNLAVADLLFVVFCIPFTAADYVADTWPFGDLWCRIVQYLIVVMAFTSIYTLVLMSIDRFLAVVHPIRSRMLRTEKVTKICIFGIWTVILTASVPVTISHGIVRTNDPDVPEFEMCQFMENDFLSLPAYQTIFFASSYLLPLMVISGLYVRMITRLWRQGSGVRMSVESQRGRKRVTRLVVVVVIAFASLWLPVQRTNDPDVPEFEMCQFMENDFLSLPAYQTIFFASSYLLPLMVISGLYVRMITRLWRQGSGVRMSVESQRGRKRVTRLVVVVVIAFASLWLPVQVILLLKAHDVYHADTKLTVILQIVAQTLAYTSSCINPVLYAFLSDNFRKAFHKAINCSNRFPNYSSDLPPARKTSYARTSSTGF